MKVYNEFCFNKQCPEYIQWWYDDGTGQLHDCISCKKVGQSHDITEYPEDCNFKSEIENL